MSSRGGHRGQQRLGLLGGQRSGCAAGQQDHQVAVQPVHALGAQLDQLLAAVGQQPQRHAAIVARAPRADPACAGRPARSSARRCRRSCGRCRPRTPAPARPAAVETSTTRSPAATSRCARCLPTPLQPSIAQVRGRHWRPNARSSRNPSALFANCRRARTMPLAFNTTTALSRLCGSTPITTLRHSRLLRSDADRNARRAALLRAWHSPLEPLLAGGARRAANHSRATPQPVGSPFASHPAEHLGSRLANPEPARYSNK